MSPCLREEAEGTFSLEVGPEVLGPFCRHGPNTGLWQLAQAPIVYRDAEQEGQAGLPLAQRTPSPEEPGVSLH